MQKQFFDPLYSANVTGLGLPLAALIFEKRGRALRYKTEIGRGRAFGIVLPLQLSNET
jgi:nitrogen-specific signal transduction histidine kinase